MCYFLTIGFKPIHKDQVKQIINNEFAIRINQNPLFKKIKNGYMFVDLTYGMCSCGFFSQIDPNIEKERLIKKYRKKGWSDSKIARVLSQKDKGDDIEDKIRKKLVEIVEKVNAIVLLYHCYSGYVDEVQFEIKEKKYLSLPEFQTEMIIEDILYHIYTEDIFHHTYKKQTS